MDSEYNSLLKKKTWSLVPLPSSKKVVHCKWAYKIKRGSDGSIARYKARLVAKGFLQQYGLDYEETFSLVVKPATVRIILALAIHFNWSLKQLDVSNAFLHGVLQEEVFMSQPLGYVDPDHPELVCKLHKAIYDLKKAPRAWFDSFTSQLYHIGFQASSADSNLFIMHQGSFVVYLLLYVDDIIITGNSVPFIDHLVSRLAAVFDLKDLGPLTYFLGLQIEYTSLDLFIHQSKYALDLLTKFNMLDCKPCLTPCSPTAHVSSQTSPLLLDPTVFRSMVGGL